jgi:antitoxin ParD1/3/4
MIHVAIPAELELFVQGVVRNGSYHDPAEVVGEALRLLARREQLLHDVKAGVEQLDRGEYTEYGVDSQQEFLADIRTEEQSRFPQPKNCQ